MLAPLQPFRALSPLSAVPRTHGHGEQAAHGRQSGDDQVAASRQAECGGADRPGDQRGRQQAEVGGPTHRSCPCTAPAHSVTRGRS